MVCLSGIIYPAKEHGKETTWIPLLIKRIGLLQLGESVRRNIIILFAMTLLATASIVCLVRPASCQDDLACSFAGTATLDGENVADHTIITAIIDGHRYSTTVPTGYGPSTYAITIKPSADTKYMDGTRVFFEIDGNPAVQIGIWQAGQNIRLDLSASSTAPTQSSASEQSTHLWVIVVLCIGCIFDISMVGGLAYLAFAKLE
jgi:hypothetical protein